MALTKKVYVDNQTVIPAANLNAIQDEVIANATAIGGKAPVQHTHTKSQITDFLDKKYSKDFKGNLKDIEVIKLIGISRNTYYKYKNELTKENLKK